MYRSDNLCKMTPMYDLSPKAQAQTKRIIESWASLQWKVLGHHYTRDDMIQEGYLVLNRVATKYPDREEDHLMSTLAASLRNRSNDLSRRRDRLPCESDLTASEDNKLPEASVSSTTPEDYPKWLNTLLAFMESATPRQLEAIRSGDKDSYLAKKCGLPSGAPVSKMVIEALGAS